jgi:hypothetical protein
MVTTRKLSRDFNAEAVELVKDQGMSVKISANWEDVPLTSRAY